MTDEEIVSYLEDNGYPPHIVRAGRKGLIERWREFIGEVEQGYSYGLEEYRHDLDLRGAIAVAGLDADPDVKEADARFQNLLIGEARVWESFAGEAFWDFGYPRNASGRLLRDLRAVGLTED